MLKGSLEEGWSGSEPLFVKNSQLVMARSTATPREGCVQSACQCVLLISCPGFWVIQASLKEVCGFYCSSVAVGGQLNPTCSLYKGFGELISGIFFSYGSHLNSTWDFDFGTCSKDLH